MNHTKTVQMSLQTVQIYLFIIRETSVS